MKFKIIFFALMLAVIATVVHADDLVTNSAVGLKDITKDSFHMGVALNVSQTTGTDARVVNLIEQHFNSIVAENCMKSDQIHPQESTYDFSKADEFVKFGEEHHMHIVGHCLVWHSQLAKWMCYDEQGNLVTPKVLKKHLKEHITKLVKRYKGRIHGWDVVNEAIVEDGSFRDSPLYQILGEEFISLAFKYAHEADPNAELYYNDYGMTVPGRRDAVVKLVKKLKSEGLRIDAVGMQGHMGMDYPQLDELETSINAFSETGVKVMITEWDMSALPTINKGANVSETVEYQKALNPYPNGLPDDLSSAWNERMYNFFKLFQKHADVISRVTVWGLTDGDSWKNDWPMRGRKEYPLLFDRNFEPKPFVNRLLNER